jgi:hypothetical protein
VEVGRLPSHDELLSRQSPEPSSDRDCDVRDLKGAEALMIFIGDWYKYGKDCGLERYQNGRDEQGEAEELNTNIVAGEQ